METESGQGCGLHKEASKLCLMGKQVTGFRFGIQKDPNPDRRQGHCRGQPPPTLMPPLGTETSQGPPHQIMASPIARPAGVNGTAHVAVSREAQLAGAPALETERLGVGSLIAPEAQNSFLPNRSGRVPLERPVQTPEEPLPAPPSEGRVSVQRLTP